MNHTSHTQKHRNIHTAPKASRPPESRPKAFRAKAIDELAPGKAVLDLGTGALALLALRAAQRGARRVFAAAWAKRTRSEAELRANGFGFWIGLKAKERVEKRNPGA